MCCTQLAGNTGCKKSPYAHHWTTSSGYIFIIKARIDNRKKLVKQQYLPHTSLEYGGPQTAEICWRVWGTPAYFNGFRDLAALLHATLVVGISQTAALNRGRHLYSAGRPSRWAMAHILVCLFFSFLYCCVSIVHFWCSDVHLSHHNKSLLTYLCTFTFITATPQDLPITDLANR